MIVLQKGRSLWNLPRKSSPFRFPSAFPRGVSAPPAGGLRESLAGEPRSAGPPSPLSRPPRRPPSGARQPGAWEGTARHWLVRGTERRDQRGPPDSGKARPRRAPRAVQPGPALPARAARCEAPRPPRPRARQLRAAPAPACASNVSSAPRRRAQPRTFPSRRRPVPAQRSAAQPSGLLRPRDRWGQRGCPARKPGAPGPLGTGASCRDPRGLLRGSPRRRPAGPCVPLLRALRSLPIPLTRFPSRPRPPCSAVSSLLGCLYRPRPPFLGLALSASEEERNSEKQFLSPWGPTRSPRSVLCPFLPPSLPSARLPLFPGARSARHKLASPRPSLFAPAGPWTEAAEFPLPTSRARPSGSGGRGREHPGRPTARSSRPGVPSPQARVSESG